MKQFYHITNNIILISKRFFIKFMKIVSPIFFFLIIGLMSKGLCYEKIKYLTVNEKITAIANCKTINNLIFAT